MWQRWWIAVGFLTRIPIPTNIEFSQNQLNRAAIYFPWVGMLLGLIHGLLVLLISRWFSIELTIIMVITIGFLLTGGFHEDGLADSADGLGGGWQKQQVLHIMKDSTIGTYGALALISVLILKWQSNVDLFKLQHFYSAINIIALMVFIQGASRITPVLLMSLLPYCRDDQTSKVKPLVKKISRWSFTMVVLLLCAMVALISVLLGNIILSFSFLLAQLFLLWLSFVYFKKRLGGYTGDLLGGLQQLSELSLLLVMLAVLS